MRVPTSARRPGGYFLEDTTPRAKSQPPGRDAARRAFLFSLSAFRDILTAAGGMNAIKNLDPAAQPEVPPKAENRWKTK
jgi:hypothetical protein